MTILEELKKAIKNFPEDHYNEILNKCNAKQKLLITDKMLCIILEIHQLADAVIELGNRPNPLVSGYNAADYERTEITKEFLRLGK